MLKNGSNLGFRHTFNLSNIPLHSLATLLTKTAGEVQEDKEH